MATQTITARVDSQVVDYVKRIAQRNWISLSSIINLKLREFMDNKELHLVDDEEFEVDFWKKWVPIDDVIEHLKSID